MPINDGLEVVELGALGRVALEFAPHEKAPTFAREDPWELLRQLTLEIQSPNFRATEKIRGLFAEAGLVSLWFYLKFIAAYGGPYGDLNESLHVDMCNFRQYVTITPGAKAALIVPRAVFKTTIAGHGASAWELVRDPSLRIGYAGALLERAKRSVSLVSATFEANEFHQWIYPETRKANRADEIIILANRPRASSDPNMQAITAGGSVQGIHVDLFVGDDIVGDDMLNADHLSTADMQRNVNWFKTNYKTLVVSMRKSRVLSIATRYAVDDTSEFIMQDTKIRVGCWDGLPYEWPAKGGTWATYYRPASQLDSEGVERSILPESFTMDQLAEMAEDDPWTYHTQYANRPHDTGSTEFSSYPVKAVDLIYESGTSEFWLDFGFRVNGKPDRIPLKHCDVVSALDPSGGTAGMRRSSRAAAVVIALTPSKRICLIDAEAGFVETTAYLEWIFKYFRFYKPRCSVVETQGPFKALISVIRDMEKRNLLNVHMRPVQSLGQKEETIRTVLQPLLQRGLLYSTVKARGKLMDELKVFPSRRLDVLDALKLAVFYASPPPKVELDPDSMDDLDLDDEEDSAYKVYKPKKSILSRVWKRRVSQANPVTGY